MTSFLQFLLPQNNGLDPTQLNRADSRGLMSAAAALADMSAPQVGGFKATPMQLLAHGMDAYRQGGSEAINQYYDMPAKQAAAKQAEVQNEYDKQNLDWFKNLGTKSQIPTSYTPTSYNPSAAPTLSSFYMPANITAKQIQQESGGNPNAVSPKGAQGLMQVMPATAKDPGLGVTPVRDNSPAENVRFGKDYTNALLQKYNGNQMFALMAYNWGPGNVDSWLAGGADPSKVPQETQQYVQNILGGQPQQGQMPQAQSAQNTDRSDYYYKLAEMQMRAGRPGADGLFSVASKYDPRLAGINKVGMPAALQIADAMAEARRTGDTQRMTDLTLAAKMLEKGQYIKEDGTVGTLEGFNPSRQSTKYSEGYGSKGGANQADLENANAKKAQGADMSLSMLDQAEKLLPLASGGVGGTALSAAKGAFNVSDETTQANENLKLISGWLVSNVPRMEGPQSNFDVINYQKMAADVGNSMKPIGDRLAALQTLREIQQRYANPAESRAPDTGDQPPTTPNGGWSAKRVK